MKSRYNLLLLFFLFSVTYFSCEKEPGCIDVNSLTFNPDAQVDDGSCVFAFDLAQGTWNIEPECDEINILGRCE